MAEETEKKTLGRSLLVLAYVLIAVSVLLSVASGVISIGNGKSSVPVTTVVMELLTALAAFAYFLRGGTKDVARFFKMFMLFAAGSYLIDFIGLIISPIAAETNSVFYLFQLLSLISYGDLLVVGLCKDLGKRWTFIFLLINVAVAVCNLILSIGSPLETLCISIEFLAMSVVSLIAAEAKYLDKKNRGRKLN